MTVTPQKNVRADGAQAEGAVSLPLLSFSELAGTTDALGPVSSKALVLRPVLQTGIVGVANGNCAV